MALPERCHYRSTSSVRHAPGFRAYMDAVRAVGDVGRYIPTSQTDEHVFPSTGIDTARKNTEYLIATQFIQATNEVDGKVSLGNLACICRRAAVWDRRCERHAHLQRLKGHTGPGYAEVAGPLQRRNDSAFLRRFGWARETGTTSNQ